jgi:hypothetical protein
MNEVYTVALRTTLTEIKNICPDISKPFILMNNDTTITLEEQSIEPNLKTAVSSLQDLTEAAASIGGFDDLLIDSEKGRVYVSRFNNMYFATKLPKKTDVTNLRTITGVMLPAIIKVLDHISPEAAFPTTSLKHSERSQSSSESTSSIIPEPITEQKNEETVENVENVETEEEIMESSPDVQQIPEVKIEEEIEPEVPEQTTNMLYQQLVVDRFGGFMVRSDTIQVDSDALQQWSSTSDTKEVSEVHVETFSGKTVNCKVKAITTKKLQGKGLIRIPEKLCDILELKKGELVKVNPVI